VIGKSAINACLLLGAAIPTAGCGRQINIVKCWSNDPDARITGCTALIQTGGYAANSLAAIYNNRGNAYDRKRDYDHAIQDFNQAIRLNQNFAAAYLGRGVTYYDKGDYDHAIQDFDGLISLNPSNAPTNQSHGLTPNKATAYYYLGNAYQSRGLAYDNKDDYDRAIKDYNDAIQGYDNAIRLNSNYAFAYYGRGLAYDRRGVENDNREDYSNAIRDYNEAVGLGPKNEGAYKSRGLAYNHEGQYDRAIQDLSDAIRLNPKDSVAYLSRGTAYIHEGDYDHAIQDFDETIRLNPKDVFAHQARGESYFLQSDMAAAISDFENAISSAPSPRVEVFWVLTLHVAMKRQGRDDSRQLDQVAVVADLSKWPGPILKLDMGKTTAGAVITTASSPGDVRRIWLVCQANYFTGEDALFHNQRAAALVRLKAARDGCPKFDIDYVLAQAELKRLGVPSNPAQ